MNNSTNRGLEYFPVQVQTTEVIRIHCSEGGAEPTTSGMSEACVQGG